MSIDPGPVLIVDDDAAVRDSLKFALEIEGLDVRLYEGGRELLAAPDLPAGACLVVDYRMPGMNGLDLIDALRRQRRFYPAILITGRIDDDIRWRAAKAGVREVLEKPLSDETLVTTIKAVLAT
jgi:two-component system, LuxR family, response regulator FixJ